MSLERLLATGLPLNRKERFYTGTVLPMILLAEGGSFFSRFTALIPGFTEHPLVWEPTQTNVQFFTEYSLVESIFGPSVSRFVDPPTTKDTPDVMILIDGESRALIALEAKMFHTPFRDDVERQMRAQRAILEYLRSRLDIDVVHHLLLVPQTLSVHLGQLAFPVITWEQIHATFAEGRSEDYFLRLLRIALDAYNDLVARPSEYGRNADGRMTGLEVERLYQAGAAPLLMGRSGGLLGPRLAEDIRTGRWRQQVYEVRASGALPNRNWFEVKAFVDLIGSEPTRPGAREQ